MRGTARVTSILIAVALLAGCGEKDEPAGRPASAPAPAAADHAEPTSPHGGDYGQTPGGPGGDGKPDPDDEVGPGGAEPKDPAHQDPAEDEPDVSPSTGLPADRRAAASVVRRYIGGLNERDGELVCSLFAAGALDELRFPERGASCAGSLTASIGYEGTKGAPVWDSALPRSFRSVRVGDKQAKVIVTVVTRFKDRDEPSVEDDIVYLRRRGDRWLIAKPSATIYRAIGIEPPITAISPPG